jgi:small conductance mechanosensitive channel
MNFDWSALWQSIVNWLTTVGIKIVVGLILVWVSFKIINKVSRKLEKKLIKDPKVDVTIASFLEPMVRKVLKFFILICFIGYIGIETSSIVAAIASAGLTVGLALQGALSNLAGGFIILLMRPFRIGDYITTCGESGTVESIQIFYTTLVTPDNKVIMVPNGKVADGSITNVSVKSTRRVDLTFSISYESDFNKAKELIRECIDKTGLALDDPQPFINVSAHSSSSIDIVTRVWVKSSNYWGLYFKLLEDVKTSFDNNGIEIPYSKVDVNIKK